MNLSNVTKMTTFHHLYFGETMKDVIRGEIISYSVTFNRTGQQEEKTYPIYKRIGLSVLYFTLT